MTIVQPRPIVLLHGVGLDNTMWKSLRNELVLLTDHPVVALDLPGHGDRPPLTRPTTLAELAEDVAHRLPGRAHLVGFSLGALIAQHLARYRPELVATLTSISSVCRRTPEEKASVRQRLKSAKADFSASVEASIQRWYPEGSSVDPNIVADTRRVLLTNSEDSYLHAYEVFATADAEISPELESIVVPSLAVTGELDPGSSPEMTRRLSVAIPGTKAFVVSGARHMLPVEEPGELARIIHHFIEESSREDHA